MHGAIMVATRNRRGKKRRSSVSAARHRRAPVDYRATVAAQPHRCWLPAEYREHERAESVLGCLNLIWRIHEARNAKARLSKKPETPNPGISETEYEAGRRYGVIVAAYRQAIGTPKGTVGNGRSYVCAPETLCRANPEMCKCEINTARYRDATHVLHLAGQRAYNATYQVVVHEIIPTHSQLADLNCGLRALARAFGLTGNGRKS